MPVDSITVDNKKLVQVTKHQATTSSKKGSATVTVPMTSDKTVAPVDTVQISTPETTQTSIKAKPKTTQQPKQEKSSWVDTAVDVISDVGAGIAGTVFGPIGGAIIGAGVKAGIGFIKAKAQGKKYTTKNLTHDLLLGAANGALGAVTLGLGGAVAKGVTKSLGKVLVTEGSKKTATFLAKEGAIGAVFGAGNEVARQTSDKITDNKDYNLGQMALATGEGAILGPIIAKGFQLVGKALKPIGKLFGGKSVEPKVETNSSTVATETATEKAVDSETVKLGEITTQSKTVGNTAKESSNRGMASYSANGSATNVEGSAEAVGLYEHGLHEIMVDPKAYQEIGQTIVHSPICEKFNPETMVKIENEILYFPDSPSGLCKKYTVTPIFNDDGIATKYRVKFFQEGSSNAYAVETIERTSKMSVEEINLMKQKYGDKWYNRHSKPESTTPQIQTEPNIMGFRIPKGTESHSLKDIGDGTKALRFLDKDGNTIRKIVLSEHGTPLSYSDFQSEIRNSSLTMNDYGHIVEEQSIYDKVTSNISYELANGKVVCSRQTRTIATHRHGKIEGRYTQKIRTSTSGDGSYLQDITIENGTKRFNIMIMQGKNGKKGQMLGNCKELSDEEIALLKSDPFLGTRYYVNNLDFVRAAHRDGMRLQGLRDTSTPLYFNKPDGPREGGYYHRGLHTIYGYNSPTFINATPRCVIDSDKEWLINHTNHEPRHGVQHDLVDDLNAGVLAKEQIEEATRYEENFAHYITQKENWDGYMNQPVEVDARRAGEEAVELFRRIGQQIDNIFRN